MDRDNKIVQGITKVKNMVSIDASIRVFTAIGGIFEARICFLVPLYRGIFQKMDHSSLVSPCRQVRYEVSINKTGDQNWFFYSRVT